MRHILVIRFGSLGDLCLLGWSLAALSDDGADRRVVVATKSGFADLVAQLRGVNEVVALDGSGVGALWRLAGTLRARPWDAVIDAHRVLRSSGLTALLGRRPAGILPKDTAARLALLARSRGGRGGTAATGPDRTMHDRFAAALAPVGDRLPDFASTAAPLSHLAPPRAHGAPVGLAPGAQWDTKRWPDAAFAELADGLIGAGRPVHLFLGPREEAWFAGSPLADVAAGHDAVTVHRGLSLPAAAARLGACSALVTNDSGLLHMAEAAGTPVVALFGPTVRQFGYFPCLPDSRVLEIDLECRPCSRNGKRACHRGDLACLTAIAPGAVLPVVLEVAA